MVASWTREVAEYANGAADYACASNIGEHLSMAGDENQTQPQLGRGDTNTRTLNSQFICVRPLGPPNYVI